MRRLVAIALILLGLGLVALALELGARVALGAGHPVLSGLTIGAPVGGGSPYAILFLDASGHLANVTNGNFQYREANLTDGGGFLAQSPSNSTTYGALYAAANVGLNAVAQMEACNNDVTGGRVSTDGNAQAGDVELLAYDPAGRVTLNLVSPAGDSLGTGGVDLESTQAAAGRSPYLQFGTALGGAIRITAPDQTTGQRVWRMTWPPSIPTAPGQPLIASPAIDGNGLPVGEFSFAPGVTTTLAIGGCTLDIVGGVIYRASCP